MISGVSSRLFQPYTCTVPGPVRDDVSESSTFMELPDIPSRQYTDLRNHPDFQAIKSRFLRDIDEMDTLARGFVGNDYTEAIRTFSNNIDEPPENIESGLFAIFDETRHQIHKLVARMKAHSSGEPVSPAGNTPERDRITLALHICLNEIDHCPAGVQSRFFRAWRSLETEPEQLNARLFLIRKTLLEEFSHTFLREAIRGGINIRRGDEVHWVNALFNTVCGQFGLDPIADPMATRQIRPDVLERFRSQLPQILSEYTVLDTLASDCYQRFCHFLDKKNLSRWSTEKIPAGKLTSDHMDDLEQDILTPLNQLCNVQDREKTIKLSTLIENDGDQYSFARCREKIQGWLTQTIMDAPATLFTRISGDPNRPGQCIGTYDNLFFWLFTTESGAVYPFGSEGSRPLTISDLSTIDVCSWPEPVQLALLNQVLEQTGATTEDGQSVAAFLLGKGSGTALDNYPDNVQSAVASKLTEKVAVSPALSTGLVTALSQSLSASIPDWVFRTPVLEPLLVALRRKNQDVCGITDNLNVWQLINFSPSSFKSLYTPDQCQGLFRSALLEELGGLIWRLLQTGYCDAMNNCTNPDNHSVLMVLCEQGVADGVAYLLKTLPNTDYRRKTAHGWTALHIVAQYGHVECLNKLLAKDDINLNDKENGGWTALHLAARFGQAKCLDTLQSDNRIALNEKCSENWTALLLAARYGHTECLEKLLTKNAITLNEKNNDGWTALLLAARYGHTECLDKLLAMDNIALNEKTSDGWTALLLAIRYGHTECLDKLLAMDNIALNEKTSGGWTTFYVAARYGRTAILAKLLAKDVTALNERHNDGWTVLHMAAGSGHTECLRVLLQAPSIRVNVRTQRGFTPLMIAAREGHTGCARLLLNHDDTELNLSTRYGRSARNIARGRQHQDIVDMLENDHRYNSWSNNFYWYLCCRGDRLRRVHE